MKRNFSHATRRLINLPVRRWAQAFQRDLTGWLGGALRSGGRGLVSLGLAALMLAFIGLLIANFVNQVMQSAKLEADRIALEEEVATLRAEQLALEGAAAYAESDAHVERVAREQLGYARDGDVVILPQLIAPTTNAEPPTTEAPAIEAEQPAPTPNWQLWWQAFFPAG